VFLAIIYSNSNIYRFKSNQIVLNASKTSHQFTSDPDEQYLGIFEYILNMHFAPCRKKKWLTLLIIDLRWSRSIWTQLIADWVVLLT